MCTTGKTPFLYGKFPVFEKPPRFKLLNKKQNVEVCDATGDAIKHKS